VQLVNKIRSLCRRAGFDVIRFPPGQEAQNLVVRSTANVVAGGPFRGLRLPEKLSGVEDRGSRLLGFYEQEIQSVIVDACAQHPDLIVNVGCYDGYYAVGLAMLNPTSRVLAYDIDPVAQRTCQSACAINAITNVDVRGLCEAKELAALAESARSPFILLDCEGAERDLLLSNPYQFSRARLLVECHDFVDANITNDLIAKYAVSHIVTIISQGARNPFEHPLTQGWPESELWQMISENRPQRMHWMSLTPKTD
jgi:hypothetical protein